MKAPVSGTTSNYGFGLQRLPLPCGDAFGHNGAVHGYSADALAFPNGRVIVALANSITLDDRLAITPEADALYTRMLLLAACGD
jgi:hypothetical protein